MTSSRDAFDTARQHMLARWIDYAQDCPLIELRDMVDELTGTLSAMRQILQLRLDEVPPRDIRDDTP